jgi:ADP-ribose pyrophosphatase YjhB (NUDIX family)
MSVDHGNSSLNNEVSMAQQSYEESYLGQLRKLVGKEKLLIIATRAVVRDEAGRVLFIRRRDNGRWAMPAGAMELDESVYDCVVREVLEETGLEVHAATLFAIWSDPEKTSIVTHYGDPYQVISFVFRVDQWTGQLTKETDETIDARFCSHDALPETPPHYLQTLDELRQFEEDGKLILR